MDGAFTATPQKLAAREKIMDIDVSPKTARRRGSPQERAALVCSDLTKEHTRQRSATEEQRSRRAVFGETLRAEALLARFVVAPRFLIPADMRARRSANQSKISLSSNVHSFLTGC